METTNTNHTEKNSTETTKKIMNDTGKEVVDMCTKNLNLVTDFYLNAFNSFVNANKGFTSMGNIFPTSTLPKFDNLYKQMMDYNTNLFLILSKGINTNINWDELSKKEGTIIENRLEATKNMSRSIIEAYSENLDSTNESNKKMIKETTEQFDLLMKQNQKLCADMFAMFQNTNNNSRKVEEKTEEKSVSNSTVKEPILTDLKKRSAFSVSDHKI